MVNDAQAAVEFSSAGGAALINGGLRRDRRIALGIVPVQHSFTTELRQGAACATRRGKEAQRRYDAKCVYNDNVKKSGGDETLRYDEGGECFPS